MLSISFSFSLIHRVELTGFFIKVIMTCASVFITNVKWLSVVQFVMVSLLTYFYLTWVRPVCLLVAIDCQF